MKDKGRKVSFISLGCPKNTVDSEIMLNDLFVNGYEITDKKEDAQIIVINTCAFINDALEESIQNIIEIGKLKEKNLEKLIVAGCMVKRYEDEIFDELPEVDAIIDTSNVVNISKAITDSYSKKERPSYVGGSTDIDYLNNRRIYDKNAPYEYVKIAEGCSNNCTFCIIPKIRGGYKSRKMDGIISECRDIVMTGKKELILIAQDTANYGKDIYGEKKLHELVNEIALINPNVHIRLMYTYPEFLYDELFEIFNHKNVVRYLDIPIQHISDNIRERMNRKENMTFIEEKIRKVRSLYPDIYIRTSMITGFPGETDNEFKQMLNFVQSDLIDFAGIFKFSPQEGTLAEKMPNQIDEDIKDYRFDELYKAVTLKMIKSAEKRIGKTYKVLCEGVSDDGIFYHGRTYFQAPEIDTVTYFTSEHELKTGEIYNVKILNNQDIDLIGEVK